MHHEMTDIWLLITWSNVTRGLPLWSLKKHFLIVILIEMYLFLLLVINILRDLTIL